MHIGKMRMREYQWWLNGYLDAMEFTELNEETRDHIKEMLERAILNEEKAREDGGEV